MKLSNDLKKQIVSRIKILLLVCAAYYLFTWFAGCPIKYFFGVSCPGCGMTRAWLRVLHLDFAGAFFYHPLFWAAPLIAAALIFEDNFDTKKYRWLLIATAALFILVYIIRLIWIPNNIVVWEPKNGAIFKTLQNFYLIVRSFVR